MEKLKILLADDLLQSREDFMGYWQNIFSKKYSAEFTECETAQDALNELEKSKLSKNYFDIVISDIDFSENPIHEGRIAGFDVITKVKEINFKTLTIWYSAQTEESAERFETEENLKRKGYIDFSLKKAFLGDHFKKILSHCIEALQRDRANLVVFLSRLFDTYNFGEDENHDLGFYKLTHSNYDHAHKLMVLPKAKSYYEESNIKSFLTPESIAKIDKYLLNLESSDPTQEEMEIFKSYFRLELSDATLRSCQQPLINNNAFVINKITLDSVPRIYCEKDRILLGLKTIYENIAKHNFTKDSTNPKVETTVIQKNDKIILSIIANGNSFNPKEKFLKNMTSGLSAIYQCFNKYCDLVYEGCGAAYNIYTSESADSDINEGIRITISISIPLPSRILSGEIIEDV